MSNADFMAGAAGPMVRIVRGVTADQLTAPTPCTEYDVRKLVHHLLFWGPSLEGGARKEIVAPPAASEADIDLTDGDWAKALEAHIDRTSAAWSELSAWEGVTHMGGPTELPAPMVGGMVMGEFVVHGWDLARATGQRAEWDDELLAYLYDETAKMAETGRQMGVFGPEVAVPTSAPMLDRLLGVTGRDPAWQCR